MTLAELSNKLVEGKVFSKSDEVIPFLSFLAKEMDQDNLSNPQILELLVRANVQDYGLICNILMGKVVSENNGLRVALAEKEAQLKTISDEKEQIVTGIMKVLSLDNADPSEEEEICEADTVKKKTVKYDLNLYYQLTPTEKEWFDGKIATLKSKRISMGVLRGIYKKMNDTYTANLNGRKIDLLKQYSEEEYGKVKCSTLTLIAQDNYLRSIFDPIFTETVQSFEAN